MKRVLMRRVNPFILSFMLLMFVLASCATLGLQPPKPYNEWTPKEKTLSMLKMYNQQYDDYNDMVAKGNLTDAQKVVLRNKKSVLVEIYPLIQGLDMAVNEGKPLDATIEKKVLELVNKLGAKLTK